MFPRPFISLICVLALALLTAGGAAPQRPAAQAGGMIAAAHPLAAAAGRDILSQGGSALDAAIATQLVLGLVEPQSAALKDRGGGDAR